MEKTSKLAWPSKPEIFSELSEWQKKVEEQPTLEDLKQLEREFDKLVKLLPDERQKESSIWLIKRGEEVIQAVLRRYDQVRESYAGDLSGRMEVEAVRMKLLVTLGRLSIVSGELVAPFLEKAFAQSYEQAQKEIPGWVRQTEKMPNKREAADQVTVARKCILLVRDALPTDLEHLYPGHMDLEGLDEPYLLHEMLYRREAREEAIDDKETIKLLDKEIESLFDELATRKENSIFSVRPLQTDKKETELFVSREEVTRLKEILALTDGGNFAVAGVRGIGKSTLLNYIKDSYRAKYIGVYFSAPRRYETLDLFHTFFIKLCEEVNFHFTSTERVPFSQSEIRRLSGRYRRHALQLNALAVGVISGAIFIMMSSLGYLGIVSWLIVALSASFLVPAAVTIWFFSNKAIPKRTQKVIERVREREEERLGETIIGSILRQTRQHLDDLYYIQRRSQGLVTEPPRVKVRVGGGPARAGLDAPLGPTVTTEIEQKRRAYTLPLITEAIKLYIEDVAKEKPIIIVFDDIDKMEVEQADAFLRDLRTIFTIKHCYFFISGPPQYLGQLLTGLIRAGAKREPDTVIDHVVNLRQMEHHRIEEILWKRLELRGLRRLVKEDTVKSIASLADGNPRNAIRFFAGGFRNWVRGGEVAITPLHVLSSYLQMFEDGVENTNDIRTLHEVFSHLDKVAKVAEEAKCLVDEIEKKCEALRGATVDRAWKSMPLSELEKFAAGNILCDLKRGKEVTIEHKDDFLSRIYEELAQAQMIKLAGTTCRLTPFGQHTAGKVQEMK